VLDLSRINHYDLVVLPEYKEKQIAES